MLPRVAAVRGSNRDHKDGEVLIHTRCPPVLHGKAIAEGVQIRECVNEVGAGLPARFQCLPLFLQNASSQPADRRLALGQIRDEENRYGAKPKETNSKRLSLEDDGV